MKRVTVSLDALDDAVFRRMNDVDFPVEAVLRGIDAALAAGLAPVKVNMVVKRGTNEHEIVPLARTTTSTLQATRRAALHRVHGHGRHQRLAHGRVLPSDSDARPLGAPLPLRAAVACPRLGETAERWRYADGGGEVGFISSVTKAFYRDCNRARLSANEAVPVPLRQPRPRPARAAARPATGRATVGDEEIAAAVGLLWNRREDRCSSCAAPAAAKQALASAASRCTTSAERAAD
ncbi:MAG: hypothetical protein U1F25_19055 [Rubrivivax sp.]